MGVHGRGRRVGGHVKLRARACRAGPSQALTSPTAVSYAPAMCAGARMRRLPFSTTNEAALAAAAVAAQHRARAAASARRGAAPAGLAARRMAAVGLGLVPRLGVREQGRGAR